MYLEFGMQFSIIFCW